MTIEINVILPTLTGKPMSHNKNNRDNYVTLNVAFQKPKTQAARDSLTQPNPTQAADSLTLPPLLLCPAVCKIDQPSVKLMRYKSIHRL